jgi:hypothetical protein
MKAWSPGYAFAPERMRWIYCVTDRGRRLSKIGISVDPKERSRALKCDAEWALRRFREDPLGIEYRVAPMAVAAMWPVGAKPGREALDIEYAVLGAVRRALPADALSSHGRSEWFYAHPSAVLPLVDAFMLSRGVLRQAAA